MRVKATGSTMVKGGELADVGLLTSFVVNAISWGETVIIDGKPIELKSTSTVPIIQKAEKKANLRAEIEANPKLYTGLMADFGDDIATFKKANPRGKRKVSL